MNFRDQAANVYVTADFRYRRKAKELAKALADLGYAVTSKWFNDMFPPDTATDAGQVALRNIIDISGSDVMVVLGPTLGRKVSFEMGVARAMGLRMVMAAVRDPANVYDGLPHEEFATMEDVIQRFKRLAMVRFKKPKLGTESLP